MFYGGCSWDVWFCCLHVVFACYYLLYCCIWLLADLCGFGLLFGALNVVVVGCCFDLRLLRFVYSCLFVAGLGWCAVGVCLGGLRGWFCCLRWGLAC